MYTDSWVASACGTATGREGGSETPWGAEATAIDVGQLTTGRLADTGPAVVAAAVDGAPVPGPAGPAVDDADEGDPVFTAGPPQLAPSVNDAPASSATAIGQQRSQPR